MRNVFDGTEIFLKYIPLLPEGTKCLGPGSPCNVLPVTEDRFIEMCTGIEKMINKQLYMHNRL